MKVCVLGSGMVGRSLAGALAARDLDVALGTRDVDASLERGGDFGPWAQNHPGVALATFADAADGAELVFNATAGTASVAVVQSIADALHDTVLVDVANPLDFSQGMPPALAIVNTDSLAEQIQAALPTARVVKTLNTVNADVMVDPAQVGGGDHDLFICGNDAEAKAEVARLLTTWFGWQTVRDLGDITAARAMEMYLPLWLRLMGSLGTPKFSITVVQ